jgi:hypothetical protein
VLALSGLTGNVRLVTAQYSRNIYHASQVRTDFSVHLTPVLGNGTLVTSFMNVI